MVQEETVVLGNAQLWRPTFLFWLFFAIFSDLCENWNYLFSVENKPLNCRRIYTHWIFQKFSIFWQTNSTANSFRSSSWTKNFEVLLQSLTARKLHPRNDFIHWNRGFRREISVAISNFSRLKSPNLEKSLLAITIFRSRAFYFNTFFISILSVAK